MSKPGLTGWLAGLAASLAVCLFGAVPAAANGPCGQDFDGNHACPVNTVSTTTYPGSLVTDNESDYFVFYAQKGTELSVTITDTENPGCSSDFSVNCGSANVELDDAQGNEVDSAGGSAPNNGITVPQSFSHTLDATGTYYLIVTGNLGSDSNENPTSVPYRLDVGASPNVQWPPPPPPPPSCVVPRFHGQTLTTVEVRIAAEHCSVGTVAYRYSRTTRRGRVLSVSPASGTHLGNDSAVNIVVSSGRRPRHGHHRKRHRRS